MEVEDHRVSPLPPSLSRLPKKKKRQKPKRFLLFVLFGTVSSFEVGEGEESSSSILLSNVSSDPIKPADHSSESRTVTTDVEKEKREEKRRLSNAFPRATYSLDLNVTYHFTI
ncbi:hypothetical protein K0M31_005853 [Melipona bicolor]|uniref:Uncharacterized protein n=1 Tax=Melipona bicolor TaxID=60889 RepID=A0AA40FUG1_9HYME|nr:hypothetical protein K0M31_005853 [Melipona bicolor]